MRLFFVHERTMVSVFSRPLLSFRFRQSANLPKWIRHIRREKEGGAGPPPSFTFPTFPFPHRAEEEGGGSENTPFDFQIQEKKRGGGTYFCVTVVWYPPSSLPPIFFCINAPVYTLCSS